MESPSVSHSPKWTNNPVTYLDRKLSILTHQFCIKPTSEEMQKLKTLDTQEKIDNAIFRIIDSRY